MKEKTIEQYLTRKVKKLGGLCWKFVSPGTNGVPDRVILYHGHAIFVELKRPGAKPRALQVQRHKEMRAQGIPVLTIDTKEKVDDFICRLQAKNMKR